MKKRILFLLCILTCLSVMAGCTFVKTSATYKKADLYSQTDQLAQSWFSADFTSMISQYSSQLDEETITKYKSYVPMQKKYGTYTKKVSAKLTTSSDDSATVTETVLTSSGKKLVFAVSFDKTGTMSSWNVDVYKTLGQTLSKAGLNVLMGLGVVFTVLIVISLIIALFGVVSKYSNNKNNPVKSADNAVVEETVIQKQDDEDLTDDLELVAVIAAAIAASEGRKNTDGLVVRSIIRRG